MIVLDISCDICRNSWCHPFGTPLRKVRQDMHRIKKYDVCVHCAGRALIGYLEVIERDLTQTEKKKVLKYYHRK